MPGSGLGKANHTAPEPVAIIGAGCRLAGDITTPEQFFSFLLAGGSAVRRVPAERWENLCRHCGASRW